MVRASGWHYILGIEFGGAKAFGRSQPETRE